MLKFPTNLPTSPQTSTAPRSLYKKVDPSEITRKEPKKVNIVCMTTKGTRPIVSNYPNVDTYAAEFADKRNKLALEYKHPAFHYVQPATPEQQSLSKGKIDKPLSEGWVG